jgi:sarcosine oxidase
MPISGDNRFRFDTIVLGVGGMGSAACLELASRGVRVLGLDRFPLVHQRGSSHGESRIIRKAYFEHPDYVPLLHRSYELWRDLEHATDQRLFNPTGLVLSGTGDGETIAGARLAATRHGIELQDFTHSQARIRFPTLKFPTNHEIVFEPGAGTLFVDDCVRAQVDEAVRRGAVLQGNEPAIDWSSDGHTVRVRTATREYQSDRLIVSAGAWANNCLADVELPFSVVRKFVGWFPVPRGESTAASGMPTYFFELPHGTFYGFPSLDGSTIKVAEHSGGEPVDDPLNVDRDCHELDLERLRSFLTAHIPGAGLDPTKHSVCLYTLTADRHFVIDLHPRWKNVAFAAGFSGHGFKFCPVVGEVLADLVQHGKASLPIAFLNCYRAGLRPGNKT